jgi:predicted acyltransferase
MPSPEPAASLAAPRPQRLVSLDAYRGAIMTLLAAGGFGLAEVARRRPSSGFWQFLGAQFEHVAWRGCALWDLIQPSFMFMVGVAIPYSYASRKGRGETDRQIHAHSLRRSLVLILLAVFLSSQRGPTTNWVFVNVLAQIGLGYTAVSLLRGRGVRRQLGALGALLVGDFLLFAAYPITPGSQPFTGFAAHWNKNANVAHAFDVVFLNLFPRAQPFVANDGGYQTLNFVPSMATMLLGLMAGELLKGPLDAREKLRRLVRAAAVCFGLGVLADPAILPGVPELWVLCPIVKRIWTPSWVLFSSGWTFALLAAFFYVVDVRGLQRWTFPLVVVGMNSIAIYVLAQLLPDWIRSMLRINLGRAPFEGPYGPLVAQLGVLALLWLACFWMYRRKLFLKI